MTYKKEITIPKKTAKEIKRILKSKETAGKDYTAYRETARFDNGYFADIELCCSQRYAPYTQATLFNPEGSQVAFTEPDDEFVGEWYFWGENDYVVVVNAA